MARQDGTGPAQVCNAAGQWVDRCLRRDDSLFTPGRTIWSASVVKDLHERFVERPDESKRDFMMKFRDQLADAPPETVQLAAETLYVHFLIASAQTVSPKRKREVIEGVLTWSPAPASIPPDLAGALDHGPAGCGAGFNTLRPFLLMILVDFARLWKGLPPAARAAALTDPWEFKRLLFSVKGTAALLQQHALLHLAFPDAFEDIVSDDHKYALANADAYAKYVTDVRADVDRRVLEIRRGIEAETGQSVRFWGPDHEPLWRRSKAGAAAPTDVTPQDPAPPPVPPPPPRPTPDIFPPYSIEDCANDTHLPVEQIGHWLAALDRKGQAVLYGPPGTGKTFVAQHLAQHLVGGTDGTTQLVQFHPSYAYEDFVLGIRPRTGDGGRLEYPTVPGRFLDFCANAATRTGPCVLILDEINRANLSRVFGELMYLLEYRDQAVTLAGGRQFSIPSNVRLIGTMNTADRSIALVDYALRRRFAFLALYPDYEVLRRFHKGGDVALVEALVAVIEDLNKAIGDRHYQVGVSFFLHRDLTVHLEDIWRMEIEPYVEEFFFDQPERIAAVRWDRVRQRLGR